MLNKSCTTEAPSFAPIRPSCRRTNRTETINATFPPGKYGLSKQPGTNPANLACNISLDRELAHQLRSNGKAIPAPRQHKPSTRKALK